jgi:hypothetical protein
LLNLLLIAIIPSYDDHHIYYPVWQLVLQKKKIMKNILVSVDFSEASFNAVSYAAFLANAFKVP